MSFIVAGGMLLLAMLAGVALDDMEVGKLRAVRRLAAHLYAW